MHVTGGSSPGTLDYIDFDEDWNIVCICLVRMKKGANSTMQVKGPL